MRILLIENDKQLAVAAKRALTDRGFLVELAENAKTAGEFALLGIYDLLILDAGMPDLDADRLTARVRSRNSSVPILMLCVSYSIQDRITSLDAGADYLLPRPFDTRELICVVNALLRRQTGKPEQPAFGDLELDISTSTLHCGENTIRLSAREMDVARFLLQSGGKNLSKETIRSRIWGYTTGAVDNHVEVYIGFLRKKLLALGSRVRIVCLRRLGYHLSYDG